jgi:hypothetical protein
MQLPGPRGSLTGYLFDHLRRSPHTLDAWPAAEGEPLDGEDYQLGLWACYELHYRGFDDVHPDWEWEPSLLALRAGLERRFEDALRAEVEVGDPAGPDDVVATLHRFADDDSGPSLSGYLEEEGTLERFREFVVHRSAYQLKEADPHTWGIPRLAGGPKAALVEIQYEEYGSGKASAMHSEMFRETMRALGLDDGYGAYIDVIPGATLATVNVMSMFGLHRRLRGAIVGHLALFEMTSTSPNARYAAALRRLGQEAACGFYDEHVEADEEHEQIASKELAGGLAAESPDLARDIVFGAGALALLEGRFAARLLGAWEAGRSSLLADLPELAAV